MSTANDNLFHQPIPIEERYYDGVDKLNYFVYIKYRFVDMWKVDTQVAWTWDKPSSYDEMFDWSDDGKLDYETHDASQTGTWTYYSGAEINLTQLGCKQFTKAALIFCIDDSLNKNAQSVLFDLATDEDSSGAPLAIQGSANPNSKQGRLALIADYDWQNQIYDGRLMKAAVICDVDGYDPYSESFVEFALGVAGLNGKLTMPLLMDPKVKNDGSLCAPDDPDPACQDGATECDCDDDDDSDCED
jgi:hypothetical protein